MTLSECRDLKLDADLLARAAWETLRAVCLRESTVGERATALAAVEGTERERQILREMEVELIAAGKLMESDLTESAPDAPQDTTSPVMAAASLPVAPQAPAKAREGAQNCPPEPPAEPTQL